MGVMHKVLRAVAAPALALAFSVALPLTASAQGLIRDAEIEQILRGYFDPLFEAAGLKPDDVNLYILQDDSLNAFVAGGQNMFIHTGLIMEARTPEELKGVVGHETGHIALGHNITRNAAYEGSGNVSLITMGLGALALFAGAPDAAMALIASAPQFQMLSFFKHTRSEEAAADLFGVQLMEKTGQSADGNVSFMEKFRYQELMSETRRDPYFRAHPISSARVSAIANRAKEISAKARPQTPEEIQQLKMSGATYEQYVGNNVFARAGMATASFTPPPAGAIPYGTPRPGSPLVDVSSWHGLAGNASGGSHAAARDLLALDAALRAGRLAGDGSAAVLRADPAVADWSRSHISFAGGAPGVNALMSGGHGWTIIVLANLEPPAAERIGRAIDTALLGPAKSRN